MRAAPKELVQPNRWDTQKAGIVDKCLYGGQGGVPKQKAGGDVIGVFECH